MGGDKGSKDPKDDVKTLQGEDADPFAQADAHDGATFAGLLSDVPAPKAVRPEQGMRRRPGAPGPMVPGTVTPRRPAAPVPPPPAPVSKPVLEPAPVAPAVAAPAAPVFPPSQPAPSAPIPPAPPAPPLAEPELMLDEPLAPFPVVVDEDNPLGETGSLPAPGLDLGPAEVFGEPVAPQPPAPPRRNHMPRGEPVAPVEAPRRPAPSFGVSPGRSFEEIVGTAAPDEPASWGAPRPRRGGRLPLVAVVAVLVIGTGGAAYVYRDVLMSVLGLGGAPDEVVAARPAPAPVAEQPTAAPTPAEVTSAGAVSAPDAGTTTGAVQPEPATPAVEPTKAVPDEPVPSSPATRVLGLTWQREGGLVLVVRTNGAVSPGRVRTLRLEAPPREVVSITGIVAATDQESVPGDGRLVSRVRLGHHPETSPPELRLVLDLATPAARLASADVSGASLRLTLESPAQ